MRKNLVFLTDLYPHKSIGAVFEKSEVTNLVPYYDKIIVISSVTGKTELTIPDLPQNVVTYNFTAKHGFIAKLYALRLLFSTVFFNELSFIRKTLKLKISAHILSVLLVEYNNAIALSHSVKKILKKHKINSRDTLLYSFWNNYRAIACAKLKQMDIHFAAISRTHGGDVYFERYTGSYLPLKQFMLEHLDAIYTISESSRDYLCSKLGDTSGKIRAHPLGVKNSNPFKNTLPGKELQIVSCSQIMPVKRLDILILGLKELEGINFTWYHIGVDWMQGEIISLAEKELNHPGKQFKFLGMKPNDEVMMFYSSTKPDLFVNTSKSEGIPVSVMEAMSFGIPVIATDVGGTREIVRHGINGYLLSPDPEPDEIAMAIKKFYSLPTEEKFKMQENAFYTWENDYNANKNYPAFIYKIKVF